ncbi:hypothetical protein B0H67DRAFT_32652 [Lasiosphaeris hirsuta]|uniref:Uncharacterized protein n=1 Tax=Lasiosphaeris hirsuta TaxID=260670 RepID=A0AA40E6U8_9PEZI|nr:hypothetical protein B0H67DRAFT_32652 [Lasiosphaeris hirsuta]
MWRKRSTRSTRAKNAYENIYKFIVEPMTGFNAAGYPYTSPPHEVIAELTAAVGGTGARLRSIDIHLEYLTKLSRIGPCQWSEARQRFSLATQRLETFTFTRQYTYETDSEQLRWFLGFYLNITSLRHVKLCFPMELEYASPTVNIGQVIAATTWPNLQEISVCGLRLRLVDITTFARRLRQPGHIEMRDIPLLSGTWEEVLRYHAWKDQSERANSNYFLIWC